MILELLPFIGTGLATLGAVACFGYAWHQHQEASE